MNEQIEKMSELAHVKEINTIADVIKVQDFVFSLIPKTEEPFIKKMGIKKGNGVDVDLFDVYTKCKNKEIGGWCGMNAEYMKLILSTYDIKSWPYNYGISSKQITHVGIVVEIDEMQFFMDPYFNRMYSYKNDFLLRFPELISLVEKRNFEPVTSVYGKSIKPIKLNNKWEEKNGEDLEVQVLNFFYKELNMENVLKETFCEDNPLLLMLIRVPNLGKR